MQSAVKIPADIRRGLQRLETEVLAEPLSQTDWIDDVCRHTLLGGKRIRPLLLLLSGGALGADADRCLQLAGTVEFIHNATLLHDDVIDEAEMRRNRPSVNRLWGKKHGILAGDMLYARAFALIADLGAVRVSRLLADTACSLAEAEFLQLRQKAQEQLQFDEALYLRIVAGKTASLFRFCCLAPALESTADEHRQQGMATFGEQFGMAFQLTDDALDCVGSLEQTGKMPGTDLRDGNLTLPLARALQQADAAGREAISTALSRDDAPDSLIAEALEAVHSTDAVAHSLQRCGDFVQRAIHALALPQTGGNAYLEALRTLAEQLVDRKF